MRKKRALSVQIFTKRKESAITRFIAVSVRLHPARALARAMRRAGWTLLQELVPLRLMQLTSSG